MSPARSLGRPGWPTVRGPPLSPWDRGGQHAQSPKLQITVVMAASEIPPQMDNFHTFYRAAHPGWTLLLFKKIFYFTFFYLRTPCKSLRALFMQKIRFVGYILTKLEGVKKKENQYWVGCG